MVNTTELFAILLVRGRLIGSNRPLQELSVHSSIEEGFLLRVRL